MRNDSIGLFWEDLPAERGRSQHARVMPPIPDTGWTPPRDFPNLSGTRVLALDTETYDPELLTCGPGWARKAGHIAGISMGTEDGHRWYFPMRHEVQPEHNMDPDAVLRFARDALETPHVAKVGANLVYDIGWLAEEGVDVQGPLVDVQYAEALLSEDGDVALGWLGQKYVGEGKEDDTLYRWCADYYGGKINGKQRANIYRAPPCLVGPYAEKDADLPLRVIGPQYAQMEREGLVDLFRMECELIPLWVAMRREGVSVNLDEAQRVSDSLGARLTATHAKIKELCGFAVNVNSAENVAKAFDKFGHKYPVTKKTNKPSFRKEFLEHCGYPIADLIVEARRLDKLRSTFVQSYIMEKNVNGKVYCSFNPLRGEKGGTRSGRLSSSNPNLQNIPSRDEELAPLIRGIFVPDKGHKQWRKYDYSQIEYRYLAHFAVGPRADEVRATYARDARTDYHNLVIQLIKEKAGFDLARKPAKTVNFGLIYGMGKPKLVRSLGLTPKQGEALFAAYHHGAPYAKATMEACSEEAGRLGYITTVAGRRSRFDLWEPQGRFDPDAPRVALPYDLAMRQWGANIRRAYLHKALNRRLQGSAAELMKRAMWRCWKDGIFAATGIPRLTVHDELDFSDPGGRDEAFREMQHVMETCMPLRVPVIADYEVGPDWGHVKEPT